ncbi:MAG: hypothetical protein Q9164_006138 [Protoblastenia rupestris]
MAQSTAVPSRELSLNHYKKEKPIGEGGQGSVYKYTHTSTRQLFAVKILEWKPDKSNRLNIVQEAFISLHTDHVCPSIQLTNCISDETYQPHVLQAHDIFTYNEGVAIIMSYFHCGDLSKIAPRLSGPQLKEALRQILHALQYFHGQGQIHRDIKPKNVLIRQEDPIEIIVADFGLVSVANPITVCGTVGYQAPEIHQIRETETPVPYTNVVDIYALGVLLLECLGVRLPSVPVLNKELYDQTVGSTIQQELAGCEDIERRGGMLVASAMLTFEPNQRPSADKCLQKPWLSHWSYIPYNEVPKGLGLNNSPSLEPEYRPTNNPVQAIAIATALLDVTQDGRLREEYIAYILTTYKRLNPSTRPRSQEEDIARILLRLPHPPRAILIPVGLKQEFRIPYGVVEYMKILNKPANRSQIKKLASILADHPIYRSTSIYNIPPQAGQSVLQEHTSTKATTRNPKGRRPKRRRKSETPDDPQMSPGQRPQAHSPTSEQPLVNAQCVIDGGIKDRLRSGRNRDVTDQAAKAPASDRMEICTRSKSFRQKSRDIGKLAAPDEMELCSR